MERALEVQWNTGENTFGFKIAAEKSLTCCGLLPTLSSVYNPLCFAAPF